MTLRIDVHPLRGSRLLEDYMAGRPEIAAFYPGHPHDAATYREKLAEVCARFDRDARERAAAALRPTSGRAAERLRRFVEEGGAVVTTGQQTGLFTGPLYTVHKILTAIRLAEALEAELGVIVLPVFWGASEDHDFAEANHAWAVDAEGALRRVAVRATDSRPVPMNDMGLGEDVDKALDDYLQQVWSKSVASDHLRNVLSAYQLGRTVAGAFEEAILRLFAGFDLLVTHAADPALKRASVPVLLGEAERAAEHERLIAERTRALEAAGYPSQVVLVEGATNLFFHGSAGRERLYRDDGGLLAKDARVHLSRGDVERMIRDEPGRFSPNVFLRPVVESFVFPTLAYVGGPAETAYFAQVGPLFGAFGIRPPASFPRFAATIVPAEAARARGELEITDDELRLPPHELLERVARRKMPGEVWASFDALRRALVDGFGGVIDAAHGIDANLDLAVGARRNRALLEVAKAERTIIRHFKQRNPELARAAVLAQNHLRPHGRPQERVLTVFQYLARRPTLLEDLAATMTVELRTAPPQAPPVAQAACG